MNKKSTLIVFSGLLVAVASVGLGATRAIATSTEPASVSSLPPLKTLPGAPLPDPQLQKDLQHWQQTGWTPIPTSPGGTGFVKTAEYSPQDPAARPKYGQQLNVYDANGAQIGFYVSPVGFVDTHTAKTPGFDWRAELRKREPDIADELLGLAKTQQTLP